MALHGAMAELTKDLGTLVTELGLRVGVNTGEVVVGARDADVVGDPVNVAARLQNEAAPGSVLIGDDTRRLVERLVTVEWSGNFQLKGRAEPVAGYRVVSLEPPADSTTFVGRDNELERIMGHFRSAVDDRCAHLVTVIGAPGLGKTRLLDEATRRLRREATVLRARCDASNTLTFAPVADAISAFVSTPRAEGVEAVVPSNWPERERLVGAVTALCAGDPGVPEETFWTVRRFLAALGHDQPVVLVLDDLQWARPLLLDLTEHLVEWSTDDALLVLGAARPELRDAVVVTHGAALARLRCDHARGSRRRRGVASGRRRDRSGPTARRHRSPNPRRERRQSVVRRRAGTQARRRWRAGVGR